MTTATPARKIHHRRFGDFEVPESALLRCEGLPGFGALRHLVLVEHDCPSPFAWLVSPEDPDLAFVVADPRRFFPDYAPTLAFHHRRSIGLEEEESYDLLAIATFGGESPTLNLAAPIVVGPRTKRAVQAILERDEYPIRAELPRGEPALPRPAPGANAGHEPGAWDQMESKPQR